MRNRSLSDAALHNNALGPTKHWPKTDFQWKLHTNRVFCLFVCLFFVFVFRIHFHYVLSYLFGLFGVRTCVSILWHTSLPKCQKMQLLLEKNSEKPWFWRFLVIFVVLTWRHLWCHCGIIQGMFVLFWYQWIREGHSYPLVPHTWCFVNRFPRSWGGGGGIRLPPAVRWVQKAEEENTSGVVWRNSMKEKDTYSSMSCAEELIGRQGLGFIKGQKRINQMTKRKHRNSLSSLTKKYIGRTPTCPLVWHVKTRSFYGMGSSHAEGH